MLFFINYMFLIFIGIASQTECKQYKPVILVHGILTGKESMIFIQNEIEKFHPGTVVYNVDLFSGWYSLNNLWYQVKVMGQELDGIFQKHLDGVHLLGYSQGGLVARAILQVFTNHTVHKFVSLSSPQAGQYGTNFLHLIFPHLALETAFELFYSRIGQHTSVGSYWNDPFHQKLYYEYCQFLPYLNNAIISNSSEQFKAGLVKLKKFILIGGPTDDVITPWESSQFGYYEGMNETVLALNQRDIYKHDLIGLKTLMDDGRLELKTIPGMNHFMWHTNINFIDKYLVPIFD